MHIVVVGLNHRTAPVEVREQFVFSEQQMSNALQKLRQTKSVMECVVISTCNRTEIYAVVDRLHMCGYFIRDFMERWFGVPKTQFTNYLAIYEDRDAVEHLFRVTCGLDSMVLGETQILGQIRDAFLLAQREGATGTMFNTLFKQAITLAKRAQTDTNINDNAVSVSYAAVELGKRIFGDYRNRNIMIVGAGKMGELTAKHLRSGGAGKVVVANRTPSRAAAIASEFGGLTCSLDEVVEQLALHEIDIVISSTGADGMVLNKEQVAGVMKQRPNRPLFMIDIAVPRDLDPHIGELDNVFLYDIDDLQAVVDANMDYRRQESRKVEVMVEQEITEFQQWYRTLGVGPVIRALQNKASDIHKETMASLSNKLPDLSERELKVIRKLSKSLLNQMLSDPILRIKELAAQKKGDEALDLFVQLFDLAEDLDTKQQAQDPLLRTVQEPKQHSATTPSQQGVTVNQSFGIPVSP